MFGQLHLGPLVEQVANEDAQTIGAHVLISGKVGIAQLLLDGATKIVGTSSSWGGGQRGITIGITLIS